MILRLKEWQKLDKCVLVFGHFSTIHPGHIRYLKYAKKLRKRLIVALLGDNSRNLYKYKRRRR